MSTYRYKAIVSYDGTNYCGYQIQKNATTIQEQIEKAFALMFKKEIKTFAASRTDKGVHALGQVIHFDLDFIVKDDLFIIGINARLPKDIRITKVLRVKSDFHARKSAKSKVYLYKIHKKEPGVFNRSYGYYIKDFKPTMEVIDALKQIEGTHDFSAFSNNSDNKPPIKTIYEASIKEYKDYYLVKIHGNSFLKYMVRSIVGNIVAISLNKKSKDHINNMLLTKSRKLTAKTIEACGLMLYKIYY